METEALHDFEAWSAERQAVEGALETTPEAEEDARARLFDRAYQLERLILHTPGRTGAAVLAKVQILRWLMEMEQWEQLPAMREVEAFVEQMSAASSSELVSA